MSDITTNSAKIATVDKFIKFREIYNQINLADEQMDDIEEILDGKIDIESETGKKLLEELGINLSEATEFLPTIIISSVIAGIIFIIGIIFGNNWNWSWTVKIFLPIIVWVVCVIKFGPSVDTDYVKKSVYIKKMELENELDSLKNNSVYIEVVNAFSNTHKRYSIHDRIVNNNLIGLWILVAQKNKELSPIDVIKKVMGEQNYRQHLSNMEKKYQEEVKMNRDTCISTLSLLYDFDTYIKEQRLLLEDNGEYDDRNNQEAEFLEKINIERNNETKKDDLLYKKSSSSSMERFKRQNK